MHGVLLYECIHALNMFACYATLLVCLLFGKINMCLKYIALTVTGTVIFVSVNAYLSQLDHSSESTRAGPIMIN